MNEKCMELNPELAKNTKFEWIDMLAFTAVWLHMDATPYRDRREYWSAQKFLYVLLNCERFLIYSSI